MARLTVNRGGWSDPDHAAPRHDAIAYGWGEDWRAGMTDDDLLARLFALNQQRAGQEEGVHAKDANRR